MTMMEAVSKVLSNYSNFSGRAARPEFWWWVLAFILLQIATSIVDSAIIAPLLGLDPFAPGTGQPLSLLVTLALLVPYVAVSVRRLHDTGRSGWWFLVGVIPIIGPLVLLIWYVQPGTPGDNAFGAAPL